MTDLPPGVVRYGFRLPDEQANLLQRADVEAALVGLTAQVKLWDQGVGSGTIVAAYRYDAGEWFGPSIWVDIDVASPKVEVTKDPGAAFSVHDARIMPLDAEGTRPGSGSTCDSQRGRRPVMPNADLIRRTVKAMEEDQERWDQSNWVDDWKADDDRADPMCGTTLCFAGFAMLEVLGPDEFAAKAYERREGTWYLTEWVHGSEHSLDAPPIAGEAREHLGLDEYAASDLFGCGTSSLDVLKQRITDATGVTFP